MTFFAASNSMEETIFLQNLQVVFDTSETYYSKVMSHIQLSCIRMCSQVFEYGFLDSG